MIGNTSIPASVTQRGNASAAAHQRFSSGNGRAFSSSRPSSGIPADLLQNLLQLVQSLIQQLGGGSQQSGKSAESTLQGDNGSGEGDQAGGAPQSDEGTSTAPPQTTYPQVALTDTERQALESLTGLTGIRVDDLDNSGTLSAGDVVVGSDPTAMKHDLTAEEIAATQPKPSPQPLELSVDQLNAIANFFNDGPTAENPGRIKTEFTGQATDNNGDGQLGVGDSVQLKDSSGGFELVHDYVLTESELKGINELLAGSGDVVVGSDPTAQPKPSPQPLGLSVDQLNAIANFFNDGPTAENPGRIKTEFTGQATDNNGDGQLGVGDSVQLKDSSGGFELVHDYVLTESELKGINELLAGSGLPAG